jgi:hypothetical protein
LRPSVQILLSMAVFVFCDLFGRALLIFNKQLKIT